MPETIIKDECIELWESQLEDAVNQLSIKTAEFNQLNASFGDLTQWVTQLQSCLDSFDETDGIRDEVLTTLTIFNAQTTVVCNNIACLKEGMEILYCDIIRLTKCVENLYVKVLRLKNDIDCLNNPSFNPSSSVFYKCLCDLQAQIELVLEMHETMINQVLHIAHIIYLMECMICNEHNSLLSKINELLELFGGEPDQDFCGSGHQQGGGAPESDHEKLLCTESLEKPNLPISDMDLYQEIKVELTTAEVKWEECKKGLEQCQKDKMKLVACKESLDNAIKEATASQNSKC